MIGVKRILVFHIRNHDSKGEKTKWVMHEYGLNKILANKASKTSIITDLDFELCFGILCEVLFIDFPIFWSSFSEL